MLPSQFIGLDLSAHVKRFDELTAVLEALVVLRCPVIVGGDLNIHVDDPAAGRLHNLLQSVGMIQHVKEPTHERGHTLDLIITGDDVKLGSPIVEPAGIISDHGLVWCELPASFRAPAVSSVVIRSVRSWKKVDRLRLGTRAPVRARKNSDWYDGFHNSMELSWTNG